MLYAPAGRVLTATTPELAQQAGAGLRLPEGGSAAPFAVVGGRPYQIVFAPLRAPQVIAWVALGFALDRPLAQQLAALAGTEVSFVYREQDGSSGTISTLDAGTAGQLAVQGLPDLRSRRSRCSSTISGDQYLTLSAPLRAQSGTLLLVAQRSQSAAMAQFRRDAPGAAADRRRGACWARSWWRCSPDAARCGRSACWSRPPAKSSAAPTATPIQVSGGVEFTQLAGTFNSMQAEHPRARGAHRAPGDARRADRTAQSRRPA